MYENLFFPKFDKVKHFDTVNFGYPSQNLVNPNLDNIKELLLDPTRDQLAQKEKYKTRSVKVLADPLNISFEEPYMDEHKTCFQKELQKYMEHQQNILGSLKPEGLKRKIFQLHQSHDSDGDLPKIIREQGSLLSEIQKQWLIIDLKREDKFNEFLQYVLNKVNEDSIKEVLYLANLIWEEYVPVQDMGYSEQEMIEFSQNFIAKHLEEIDQKITQINYKGTEKQNNGKGHSLQGKQRLNQFKKFATFFTTTILMVISGYFENPYTGTEENYYKRQLNELGMGYQNEDEYEDGDFESQQQEVIINKRIKF